MTSLLRQRPAAADISDDSLAASSSSNFDDELEKLMKEELLISQMCEQLGRSHISSVSTRFTSSSTPTTESVRRDLTVIQTRLRSLESSLHQLKTRLQDEPEFVEVEQRRKVMQIEKHMTIVEDLHGTLRTSILRARAECERAAVAARQELMGTNDPMLVKRRQQQHADENAALQSATFTQNLQCTRNLLRDEISRSSAALKTLTDSTGVLGDTGAEYHAYGKTVKIGSKIITKQLQRERTDKLLILVGLCFFTLVVCYIVNKRLAAAMFWWASIFVTKSPAHVVQPGMNAPPLTTGSTNLPPPQTIYYQQPIVNQQHQHQQAAQQPTYTPTPTPITPVNVPHQPQQQQQQQHHYANMPNQDASQQFGHVNQQQGIHAYDEPVGAYHHHDHAAHGHAHQH